MGAPTSSRFAWADPVIRILTPVLISAVAWVLLEWQELREDLAILGVQAATKIELRDSTKNYVTRGELKDALDLLRQEIRMLRDEIRDR